MIYAAVGLGILSAIFIYATFNLMIKVEKYEDVLDRQTTTLESIYGTIINTGQQLRKVDQRGTFEADDEIGFFFDSIKELQSTLDTYIQKDDAEKEV